MRLGSFAIGGGVGAAIAHFFDPDAGHERRTRLRDRAITARRTGDRMRARARSGAHEADGELDSEEGIRDLVDRISRVAGVRQVENLLHLPGRPAPNKEALRASRRAEAGPS